MRACKARAPDEGGMMKKLSGQNFNKLDNFCYVLFVVNEIVILSEISMFPGSETISGQEISLGIRI